MGVLWLLSCGYPGRLWLSAHLLGQVEESVARCLSVSLLRFALSFLNSFLPASLVAQSARRGAEGILDGLWQRVVLLPEQSVERDAEGLGYPLEVIE